MDKNLSSWSPKEMGSIGLPKIHTRIRVLDVSSDNPQGKPFPCSFNLYYFFGANFALQDPSRKNILFIPGGPGEIVEPNRGDLDCLERFHNVVYFHVRGTGLSRLPGSNKYDRFLRADYVVEDIERIRRHVFQNDRPWDAIIGVSHGALIAQHFAYKFGAHGVKKLILAAPPARSRDTLDVRRRVTVSNLREIYKQYRSRQRAKRTDEAILSFILNHIDIFEKANAKGGKKQERDTAKQERENVIVEFTNDLAFIGAQRVRSICQRLSRLLNALERRYYSISFVVENYKYLVENDESFKDYLYPYELFVAIKQLQMLGRPLPGIAFNETAKRLQANAALTIGYYLTLPKKQLAITRNRRVRFQNAAPLVQGLAEITRNCYFERLKIARKDLLRPSGKSYRAYYVFGIHDGISRWILEIMKQRVDRDGFFRGQAIQNLGDQQRVPDEELVATQLAKNIGVIPTEPIFPWYPGEYRHHVPTLVLRGAADAVTAGFQAEDFFKDGIMNKVQSVLLEFPGAGHMILSLPGTEKLSGETALGDVIGKFLSKGSRSTFLRDTKVRQTLRAYGISRGGSLHARKAD